MTISDTARQQVFAQEGGGFLSLLTISHPDLPEVLRFVNNTENVTVGGDLYIAYPFKVKLPKARDRTVPSASLEIDNVSRDIGQAIRQISSPPTITIEVVRLDDVEVTEVTYPPFQLRNVKYDALTVSGELTVDDMMREPYPQRSFSPAEYPGAHQ